MSGGDGRIDAPAEPRRESENHAAEAGRGLVSFCLATRNRKDEVLAAIESCYAQSYRPIEVLVFDDASSDGTEAIVRAAYPDVRYFRLDEHTGIAGIRNLGLREARGEYVFSIDDDAYYTSAETVERAVRCFEERPEAAIVALTYVEPYRENPPGAKRFLPKNEIIELANFISCAYGIRRKAGLEVGNYRGIYFYRGEEPDLSIRLLERGYSILYLPTPPIVHTFSASRDWDLMTPLGIRNTFLFTYLNVPHPYLVPRLLVNAANLCRYKVSLRRLPVRLYYVVRGLAACLKYRAWRRRVPAETFRRFRALPRHGPEQAEDFPGLAPLKRSVPSKAASS